MPGNEQLSNQTPGPGPNRNPAQPAAAGGETPEPDLLAEAAAGNYDLGAEAQAFLADTPGANAGEGTPPADEAPGAGPDTRPEPSSESGPSRLMGALQTAGNALREGGRWAAPAAADALRKRSDIDVYGFLGREQPPLNEDQRFASGVLQFAGQRVAEHLAERAASAR